MQLTVNGSNGIYDVSAGSTFCSTTAGVRSCTLPVSVPVGTTTVNVIVSVYSGVNASGSLLGGGSGSTTMSPTATSFTVPPIDVSPAVASVTATMTFGNGFPRFIYGTNESGTMNLTFKDGSGATIPNTSSSTFLTPINLTASDPTVMISGSPVTNAAQAVQLTYNGALNVGAGVTITATPVGGSPVGSLAIAMSGFPTTFAVGAAKGLRGIAAGADGYIWFTELTNNTIGKIPVGGSPITEFPIPTSSTQPQEIAPGPTGDQQMWFGETYTNEVGSIDTATGVIHQHNISGSNPQALVAVGSTGMWTALNSSNNVYAFDTNGTPAPTQPASLPSTAPAPAGITVGSDSNVWVTAYGTGQIFQFSPMSFALLNTYNAPGGAAAQPLNITSGSDGALWFTEYNHGDIGRITTAGVTSTVPIPGPSSGPYAIASGPVADGGVWFTMPTTGAIGRIDPVSHLLIVYTHSGTAGYGITAGPDGNIWFTDSVNGNIVRLVP